MLRSLHLPLALCACLLTCVPAAIAQTLETPEAFEQVVNQGLREYQAGQYVQARASFERAHALAPSARTLRALGMTAVELRRYTAARMELEAALVDTRQPLTEAQRAEVTQMLTWMGSTLASVRVQAQPADARILVDGQTMESRLLLEPGPHQLRVEAEGYEPNEQRLQVVAGQDRTVEVSLARERLAELPSLAPEAQLTAANSASAPVFTQPSAEPARDRGGDSVLKKWWFWTAIGVVVVAGTTAAVVAASSGKHDSQPAEPAGTPVLALQVGH